MDFRGQESPMDFQWDNSSGTVDPNSPFRMSGIEPTLAQETPVKKGTQSIFLSSPIKQPIFSTPGSTTTFTLATPFKKPLPQPSFQTPAFTAPRRSSSKDFDIFSTPDDAQDTDSEAPTPDTKIAQLLRSGRKSGISGLALPSGRISGRGELRRGGRHDGAINKPRRRRNRRTEFDRASDDDESDDEETGYASRPKSPCPRSPDWLYTHQSIPAVLSGYLQLFIHASWVALTVYILFACFRVVRDDMDHRVQEAASEVVAQIANCHKNYMQNQCAPNFRVPAMELSCTEWERCMNQDPAKVSRAKVSAATIAEILNGFVNELHWKTMSLVAFLVTVCWIAGNLVSPKTKNHPHPYVATAVPPLANQWTPHQPPTPSHYYQQHQQPWTMPLTKKQGLFDHQPTPRDDGKSLEWR